jgi:Methyltransferase domain
MRGFSRIKRLLATVRLWPPRGCVRWGSLRRTSPISRVFGLDRGKAIDRYYIEKFLTAQSAKICGAVLEIGDDRYTKCFGGPHVTRSQVLHAIAGNPKATLIGDLQTGQGIPTEAFDCIILTQTLQFIYDMKAAVQTMHRSLRPGGVVLATGTGISQISRYDMDRWGEYWRFTSLSARRMFEEVFGLGTVTVKSYGNVLAATASLQGISANELKSAELDVPDEDYEVVITIEAVKRA